MGPSVTRAGGSGDKWGWRALLSPLHGDGRGVLGSNPQGLTPNVKVCVHGASKCVARTCRMNACACCCPHLVPEARLRRDPLPALVECVAGVALLARAHRDVRRERERHGPTRGHPRACPEDPALRAGEASGRKQHRQLDVAKEAIAWRSHCELGSKLRDGSSGQARG